jgi:hypothetical protein
MHRLNIVAVAAVITLGFLAGCAVPTSTQSVTVFEGARLIVGDGRVIDNATLVVEGARIAQVGRPADVRVPGGATRVNLAGKTVMPMIIDTHVHLGDTRDALIRDLRMRAYYGVSAALSMGNTDGYKLLDMRGETIPGAARFRTAGRGITMPEPGAAQCLTGLRPWRKGARRWKSSRRTKSTSSRSGSTPGTASTRN